MVHRSLLDWEWYDDINTFRLFMHILLKANYKDKNWRGIEVKRGQLITSFSNLSKETGLSVRSVRTSINKLKSTCELTCEATSKATKITICKYDTYQDLENRNDKQNDTQPDKRATNERQASDNNIKKKERKERKKTIKTVSEYTADFEAFWIAYGRKGNKKKAFDCWCKLKPEQVEEIRSNLPAYLYSTRENVRFRKDAERYLNPQNEHWNDVVYVEQAEYSRAEEYA